MGGTAHREVPRRVTCGPAAVLDGPQTWEKGVKGSRSQSQRVHEVHEALSSRAEGTADSVMRTCFRGLTRSRTAIFHDFFAGKILSLRPSQ